MHMGAVHRYGNMDMEAETETVARAEGEVKHNSPRNLLFFYDALLR
jgi:hypothetical protein